MKLLVGMSKLNYAKNQKLKTRIDIWLDMIIGSGTQFDYGHIYLLQIMDIRQRFNKPFVKVFFLRAQNP